MFTFYEARSAVLYLYRQRYTTLALLISAISVYVSYQFQGPHQDVRDHPSRAHVSLRCRVLTEQNSRYFGKLSGLRYGMDTGFC